MTLDENEYALAAILNCTYSLVFLYLLYKALKFPKKSVFQTIQLPRFLIFSISFSFFIIAFHFLFKLYSWENYASLSKYFAMTIGGGSLLGLILWFIHKRNSQK